MEERVGKIGCPSSEELSAYFDGEKVSPQISAHVGTCKHCSAELEGYRKISQGIKTALVPSKESELFARIRTGVHEKLKRESQESSTINFPYWLSSIAAGMAICALGAYMVTHMEKATTLEPQYAMTQPASVDGSQLGSVDLKNLASVSFGGDDGANMIARNSDNAQPQQSPVIIESKVNHIWTAPYSAAEVKAKLSGIVSAIDLDPKAESISQTQSGETKATFKISRKQTVMLVRALKASGFDLLSPQQPQPEQTLFCGSGDEPVSYEASFVGKR